MAALPAAPLDFDAAVSRFMAQHSIRTENGDIDEQAVAGMASASLRFSTVLGTLREQAGKIQSVRERMLESKVISWSQFATKIDPNDIPSGMLQEMNQLRTFGAQIFQHAAEARRAFDVERNRNLAALRTERDDLSNTLARIKEEKLNTESRLRTLLGEVDTLRRNDETLRAECAALRRLLQGGSEQERQRLENENRALRAKCADLQRLQGGSEQERQRLENENRALRAECAGFRARLAQFEQKEE